jgi:hypothetical protein
MESTEHDTDAMPQEGTLTIFYWHEEPDYESAWWWDDDDEPSEEP